MTYKAIDEWPDNVYCVDLEDFLKKEKFEYYFQFKDKLTEDRHHYDRWRCKVRVQGEWVTMGITDYVMSKKKRVKTHRHAYVMCKPHLVDMACDVMLWALRDTTDAQEQKKAENVPTGSQAHRPEQSASSSSQGPSV